MLNHKRILPYVTKLQLQRRMLWLGMALALSTGFNIGAVLAEHPGLGAAARAAFKTWLLGVLQ